MTTRYLTVATFKTWLRSELALEDTVYEAAINSAELWLDSKCKRRFEVAGAPAARTFDPTGTNVLYIHDAASITSVVDAGGSTLVAGTDYRAYPLGGIADDGESVPYTKLRRTGYWFYGSSTLAVVTVTAAWGWTAIPLSIVEACKIVAKDFFQARDVDHGVIGVSDAGGVGTRQNRLVQDAIATYRHPNFWGVG